MSTNRTRVTRMLLIRLRPDRSEASRLLQPIFGQNPYAAANLLSDVEK